MYAMTGSLQAAAIIHSNQRITLWISIEQTKKVFCRELLAVAAHKKGKMAGLTQRINQVAIFLAEYLQK